MSRESIWLYLTPVILSLIILSPMLHTGYISDDASYSMARGRLLENNQSWLSGFQSAVKRTIFQRSRFLTLGFFTNSLTFIVFSNLHLYKMYILFLIITNLVLFQYFIALLTKSKFLSFLSAFLVPLFSQFRLYHDPILSFGGAQQIFLLWMLLSLITFDSFLKTGKKWLVALSLFLYLLLLNLSEMAYLVFVFHILMQYFHSDRGRMVSILKRAAPFVLLSALFIVIAICIKIVYPHGYEGSTPNLNLSSFLTTLAKQAYAAVPLSYFLTDPHYLFAGTLGQLKNQISVNHILIFLGYVIAFLILTKAKMEWDEEKRVLLDKPTFLLGLALFTFPGIFIGASSKYQRELIWGVGYIYVYFSYFGLSLILSLLIYKIDRSLANHWRYAFGFSVLMGMVCGVVGMVNYNNNEAIAKQLNYSFLYPRTIIEEAMTNGLLKGVPNGSCLLVETDYDLDIVQGGWNFYRWDRSPFYLMHSGVKVRRVLTEGNYLKKDESLRFDYKYLSERSALVDVSQEGNVFFLTYSSHSNEDGFAIVSKVEKFVATQYRLLKVTSREPIYLYVRIPFYDRRQTFAVTGYFVHENGSEPFSMEIGTPNLISSGRDWRLFKVISDHLLDLKSLKISSFPLPPKKE